MPSYDEKAGLNPIRQNYDKLIKLKLQSYLKQGCPPLQEINHLQNESLHIYSSAIPKNKRKQKTPRNGLLAQGEKKLMTDYAFYQEIVVKFEFIKQAQDEIDKAVGYFSSRDAV